MKVHLFYAKVKRHEERNHKTVKTKGFLTIFYLMLDPDPDQSVQIMTDTTLDAGHDPITRFHLALLVMSSVLDPQFFFNADPDLDTGNADPDPGLDDKN